MQLLLQLLRFISISSAAIVTGGQLCVLLVIIPAKGRLAGRDSVLVHNAMLGNQIDRYMKPSAIASAIAAATILVLGSISRRLPVTAVVAYGIGLLGTLGVTITSRYYNVPTNAVIAQWSLDAIPENYPEIRRRWDVVHAIRASCGALAFTGYLLAALACIDSTPA